MSIVFKQHHHEHCSGVLEWMKKTPCFCKDKKPSIRECDECTICIMAALMTEAEGIPVDVQVAFDAIESASKSGSKAKA